MNKNYQKTIILTVLLVTLSVKILMGINSNDAIMDLITYKNWAEQFTEHGFSVYLHAIIDYPPLYFMMLSPMVLISRSFPTLSNLGFDLMLYRLIPIIADFGTAYLLYHITIRMTKRFNIAMIVGMIYLLHPAVLINSSLWGQTDGMLSFFMILALILFYRKKLTLSIICCGIALMFKPTAILFAPLLGALYLMTMEVKKIGLGLLGFVIVILGVSLPFKGFSFINLYFANAQKYPYAALRSANLHTLLGGDLKSDQALIGEFFMTYRQLGLTLLALAFLVIIWKLYRNKREGFNKLFTWSWLYLSTIYMFMVSMHERYLFFAIPLGLLALIENPKDKLYRWLFVLQGSIIAINHFLVFYFARPVMQLNRDTWINPFNKSLVLLSFFSLIIYIALFVTVIVKEKNKTIIQHA